MGSNEKFCLRWNDFESNISVAFREIREEKDFFDCTLSVGDRQLQAHKLILSACSPFFRSVLKKNPHQHPLLYLKGVQFSDLQSVLNFMYHGEVNVAQEELNSFLAVAEDLKVKGLTQNNSSKEEDSVPKKYNKNTSDTAQQNPSSHSNTPPRSTPITRAAPLADHPTTKRPRPPPPQQYPSTQQHDDDIQEVLPVVKTEPVLENQQPTVTTYQQSVEQTTSYQSTAQTTSYSSEGALTQMEDQTVYGEEDGYDYGDYEEGYEGMEVTTEGSGDAGKGPVDQHLVETETSDGLKYHCGLCGHQGSRKYDTGRHIQTVHLQSGQSNVEFCEICQKSYKNLWSLRAHMHRLHGTTLSKRDSY